jgi:glyoxylase-like metal-dependent hydrolase (beta-lactamase superfamily II)
MGRTGMTTNAGTHAAGESARTICVVADNPGPMTLDGTNTWVLHEPGSAEAIVVDPGPDDETHLHRVLDTVRSRGARVQVALLTHGHDDHSGGVGRFAELAGCPVRASDPAHRVGARPGVGDPAEGESGGLGLADGDVVTAGGLEVRVLTTPGHTADSVSFLLPVDEALLTGDTVLGRGTTVVAHPDGGLAEYLASLDRLRTLAAEMPVRRILPGHGPVVDDPLRVLDFYLAHRAERLDQVRAAVAAGARTPRAIVELVYADVDQVLWPAAEQSVRAQLDYLDATGQPATTPPTTPTTP